MKQIFRLAAALSAAALSLSCDWNNPFLNTDPTARPGQGTQTLHNTWTWMGGSDQTSQAGVYGTKGVPAPENIPGSRTQPIAWSDAAGNFWLFGGDGFDRNGDYGLLNDVWRFDGNQWTWVGGSDTVNAHGVYGTQGTPSPGNIPGARYGAMGAADSSGNFWLFGGAGYDYDPGKTYAHWLTDLWKFDGENWTWVTGSNTFMDTGSTGTKGVPSPSNRPRNRESGMTWMDKDNQFWIFCGKDWGGTMGDLWRWDGACWTWMSGAQYGGFTPGARPDYGVLGVPVSNNLPGTRIGGATWTDSFGNLWLFGGNGVTPSYPVTFYELNDLWKWDGADWTWMGGPSFPGTADFGVKGVAAPTNLPGPIQGSAYWTGVNGDFWLLGGDRTNALWKFDGTNWTWVSGTNVPYAPGTFGERGVPSVDNSPPFRLYGIGWTDRDGNLWLFGGAPYRNDFWRYIP